MADVRNPRLLYIKSTPFLTQGILASTLLLLENPRVRTAALLAIAVWSVARPDYFTSHVIEFYTDRSDRFAGLPSFLRYLTRRQSGREP
jgi:hypothetical protein